MTALLSSARDWARRGLWIPALLTLLITTFRAWRPSLWSDELYTWRAATMPAGELWAFLDRQDAVIGPYYLMMRGWCRIFGTSELAMRAPSILAMTATAGLIVALGARLWDTTSGMIAGLAFAVIPAVTVYGQQARAYALVMCFATAAALLLLRALDTNSWWRWVAYAAMVALLGLAHVIALIVLAAHALVAWRQWRFWLAVGVGVLPALPLLWIGRHQRQVLSADSFTTVKSLLNWPAELASNHAVGGALVVLAAVGFALALQTSSKIWWLAGWAVLPVAILALIGTHESLWFPRYVLFVLPAWVLLAASVVRPQRAGFLALGPAIALVLSLAVLGASTQRDVRRTGGAYGMDYRAAASVISARDQPGDAIVFGGDYWTTRPGTDRYLPASGRPADVTRGCTDLAVCLAGRDRLWLVRRGALADPLAQSRYAKEGYKSAGIWHVTGVTIQLAVRK